MLIFFKFLFILSMIKRVIPKPDQRSVWDFPRPPSIEKVKEQIRIILNGELVAETNNAIRVLETSHPPNYYIPPEDINMKFLKQASGSGVCEWKGRWVLWDITVKDKTVKNVGWSYPDPVKSFKDITNYIGFYARELNFSPFSE